jgi:hypothetical protein
MTSIQRESQPTQLKTEQGGAIVTSSSQENLQPGFHKKKESLGDYSHISYPI